MNRSGGAGFIPACRFAIPGIYGDFFMADDKLFEAMMKKALRLARKGEGYTSPNPMVGAVIFNGDGVISAGYHKRAGEPHAEIVALRKAGDRARGASLAVNLEPCCHFGRTPPCTEAIIKAGIKEVICSIKDPHVRVRGRGYRQLSDNGIGIISGVYEKEATRLNEVYLSYVVTGRPFVVLKMAQSLNARITAGTGVSKRISCPEALSFVHKLRARYDAVAVGAGTVKTDNPRLTVRHVRGPDPLRIIITSSDDLPGKLNLFVKNHDNKTIVATSRDIISRKAYSAAITWPVRKRKSGLDLRDLLDQAGKRGVTSILFEGGQRLATSLIGQNLVNKLYLIITPTIIGRGIEAVADFGITRAAKAVRFDDCGFKKIGTDILFLGYPER